MTLSGFLLPQGGGSRRRMHYFSFEISNAPDWYGDVRRCRTGLNPHFLFVLPKRLPGFPAELYRFGTEKPGGYSLLKRECPPSPLKRNAGGISISPRTPLKRHKGAGCGPPLWKPLPGQDGGAAAEREAEGVLFAPRNLQFYQHGAQGWMKSALCP